ncbi:uncharacterized protein LOC110026367 [Phalaenopsis equestris]|uniref:uncharacterized protein LOC110026367 n=1 Tax=Phalaenopsis equestris TaxID=78828 RepID=UPI0009E2410E|nr:uncharacterized protein LOC110026367 [Phalaenopsis equestris]
MDYSSSALLSHNSILGGNKNLKMSSHGFRTLGITASTKLPLASTSVTSLVSFQPFKLNQNCGRRALFSFLVATAVGPQGIDSMNALLQEYRKRSIEKKPEYDKQRLDDYYNRNYKEYFELIEGFSKGKSEDLLSESEKGIREWLQRNKK